MPLMIVCVSKLLEKNNGRKKRKDFENAER